MWQAPVAVPAPVAALAAIPVLSPAVNAIINTAWGPLAADGSDAPFLEVLRDLFGVVCY
jgi:hypothetical protein